MVSVPLYPVRVSLQSEPQLGAVGCGYLVPLPVVTSLLPGYSHCCSSPSVTAHFPLLPGVFAASSPFLTLGFCLFYAEGVWHHPQPCLKAAVFNPRYICVSLAELSCHPSCQPFQQCLFHPGGHIPQVFPAHRRKCPSPTFFKPWGSHPFPYSQVMAPVSGENCGSSAGKIWLVGTKPNYRNTSTLDLCVIFLHRNSGAVFGYG